MSSSKEKHQHDWGGFLAAARGTETRVLEELYLDFERSCAARWEQLAARGVVCVAPAPRARNRVTLSSSELGVTATSMLSALGLQEFVVDCVVTHLSPRCSRCEAIMNRPVGVESLTIPSEGFVVAIVSEPESEYSLRERCELFGVERALVNGHLIRVDTLGDEEGEPALIVVDASEVKRLKDEVVRWFAQGGEGLTLLHLANRESPGVPIGSVSSVWRCGSCDVSVPAPTRMMIAEREACSACRGAGWIASERDRFVACRDCEGFGSLSPIGRYDFCGTELRNVAALSWSEFGARVETLQCERAQRLGRIINQIQQGGFGDYPLGASAELMSVGERSLLTILAAKLSGMSDLVFVCDPAMSGLLSIEDVPVDVRNEVAVIVPDVKGDYSVTRPQVPPCSLVMRNVGYGPLVLKELSIPIGAMTAIQGPPGAGTSLLLDTIAARFARKKILAHENDFGPLKRLHVLASEQEREVPLLAIMGLAAEFAREIARLRVAKEGGLFEADLVLPSSRYRCDECGGCGVDVGGGECSLCGGTLFDWRVSQLPMLGLTVGEILRAPLAEVARLPWSSEKIQKVLEALPHALLAGASLSVPGTSLAPIILDSVRLHAGLAALQPSLVSRPSVRERLDGVLILIDGPRVLPPSWVAQLAPLLSQTIDLGATIVFGGAPKTLESMSVSVIRLRADKRASGGRESFLDTRYARWTSVSS